MTFDAQPASDYLWHAWTHGVTIENIPVDMRPLTRAQGYAVQALLEPRSSRPPAGWKIAATSVAGQKHINVSGPLAGRVFTERVHQNDSTLSLTGNQMSVAEAEFVFSMARPAEPRVEPYTVEETMTFVGELYLGIEVPNSRFTHYVAAGEAQIIADNACAHQFVLGPRVEARWRQFDLARHRVHASVTGRARQYEREGVGANVLGDPRIALTWLVNELSANGIALAANQFVTTGTCLVPLEIQAEDTVSVDFGEFGRVGCSFIP
jgi:2-keto-4-pentenoate hydratase